MWPFSRTLANAFEQAFYAISCLSGLPLLPMEFPLDPTNFYKYVSSPPVESHGQITIIPWCIPCLKRDILTAYSLYEDGAAAVLGQVDL